LANTILTSTHTQYLVFYRPSGLARSFKKKIFQGDWRMFLQAVLLSSLAVTPTRQNDPLNFTPVELAGLDMDSCNYRL